MNDLTRQLLDQTPPSPCFFELYRFTDDHGLSTRYAQQPDGKVLEGAITSDGSVMVRWLSRYGSFIFFKDWSDFVHIHVNSHVENATVIKFHEPGLVPTRTWPASREEELVDKVLCSLGEE